MRAQRSSVHARTFQKWIAVPAQGRLHARHAFVLRTHKKNGYLSIVPGVADRGNTQEPTKATSYPSHSSDCCCKLNPWFECSIVPARAASNARRNGPRPTRRPARSTSKRVNRERRLRMRHTTRILNAITPCPESGKREVRRSFATIAETAKSTNVGR